MLPSLPEIKNSPRSSESRTDVQRREKKKTTAMEEQRQQRWLLSPFSVVKSKQKIAPWLHNQSKTVLAEKKKSHHPYYHCYLQQKQLKPTKPRMQLLPAALAPAINFLPAGRAQLRTITPPVAAPLSPPTLGFLLLLTEPMST